MNLNEIALTGGSGTIGSEFPKTCHRVLSRLESREGEMHQELLKLNPRAKALVHLAGLTTNNQCQKDPQKARAINVDGSVKWFHACHRAGIKRFIYVSSSHVYAPASDNQPLTSSSKLGPVNLYGQIKLEAEEELLRQEKLNPEVQLVIARVFSVLSRKPGPGFLLDGLIKRAQNKDFSPIPGLSNIRDFLWAKEVAENLVNLSFWKDSPPVVLICSGKEQTVRKIAEEVFKEFSLDLNQLREDTSAPSGSPYLVGTPTKIPSPQ